jgi:hypothetical protein
MSNYHFNRINGFPSRNRRSTGHFNYNQRAELDFNVNMYNSTLRQIDSLYDYLSELRHNIDHLIGIEDNYISENVSSRRINGERNHYSPSTNNSDRNILANNIASNNLPANNIASNNLPANNLPANNLPANDLPANNLPANNLPANDLPANDLPANDLPANDLQPNNNYINDIISLLNNYTLSGNLTNEEIVLRSTRMLTFSDIENPINDRCPISHELFLPEDEVVQIIQCGHIFNNLEINTWFNRNLHCPVCRYNIRDYLFTNSNLGIDTNSNSLNGNLLNNDLNRGRYDFRYDISGNYLLFETFYRPI